MDVHDWLEAALAVSNFALDVWIVLETTNSTGPCRAVREGSPLMDDVTNGVGHAHGVQSVGVELPAFPPESAALGPAPQAPRAGKGVPAESTLTPGGVPCLIACS
jgi:hypothetical protein